MPPKPAWWLRAPDGSRRRIGPGGVLIGRRPDCEIVLRAAEASRAHALVHLAGDEPHLVPMGRGPTHLEDELVESPVRLPVGARVGVPGLELVVEVSSDDAPAEEPQWVLEHMGGQLFGVGSDELSVGGGSHDDISIDGLPPNALRVVSTAGRLAVELGASGTIDKQPVEAGGVEALRAGSRIEIGEHRFRVVPAGDQGLRTTVGTDDEVLPSQARLEFLPRGGRLHVELRGRAISAYLADRRCDLVACLLSPPTPYGAGDYVPDDMVLSRVWPGQSKSRTDLNVLVHRVRKDLVRAGADGCHVVVRAPGGGATKFALGPEAKVSVK